jgi:hypothetical protein
LRGIHACSNFMAENFVDGERVQLPPGAIVCSSVDEAHQPSAAMHRALIAAAYNADDDGLHVALAALAAAGRTDAVSLQFWAQTAASRDDPLGRLHGMAAIHVAALHGTPASITALVRAGSDPEQPMQNICAKLWLSPIHIALLRGSVAVCAALVACGARIRYAPGTLAGDTLSGVATDEPGGFGAPVPPRRVRFTVSFLEAWAIGGDESCLTWLLSHATFSAVEFVLAAGAGAFAARGGDVLGLLLARPLSEASAEAPSAAAVSTATAAAASTAAAAAGGAPAGAGVAASPAPAGISTGAVAGDDSIAIRIEQPVSPDSVAPASLRAHVRLASAAALSLWCSFGVWDTDRRQVYDSLSYMKCSAAGMSRLAVSEREMATSLVAKLPSLGAWLASAGWIDELRWGKLLTQSLIIATFCGYPAVVAALVRHGAAIVDSAEGGTGNSALVAGLPDWNCSWYKPDCCRCLVANLRTLVRLGGDPYAGQRVRTGITGSLQRYHRTTLVGRDNMPVPPTRCARVGRSALATCGLVAHS